MGPVRVKRYAGKRLVRAPSHDPGWPRGRATYRETPGRAPGGYIFGALCPHTGKAFTAPYRRRTKRNYLEFLESLETWIDPASTEVVAILDNLNIHRAEEVLLFMCAHPRWEFLFIPIHAAYLNLIEPWWKTLRSIALSGSNFSTWEQLCQAIEQATNYWNRHRHPYLWGHRRHQNAHRDPGVASIRKLTG